MPRSHQSAVSGCGPGRQIPALDAFCVAKHFLPCPHFISKLAPTAGRRVVWHLDLSLCSFPPPLLSESSERPFPTERLGFSRLCSGHWPATLPCPLDTNTLPPPPTQGIPCPCVLPVMPFRHFLLLLSPTGWHLPLSPQPLCLQGLLPECSPHTD